ncbi:putative alpha/beta hydrolase [Jackrogersella minutella]|nr:putative alpha/beta hydrolase [Jackrogersella minutella]
MVSTQTVHVPHLDATVGFAVSNNRLDLSKPTCVLVNPFCATVEYYRAEMNNEKLTSAMNLLAIEPLGHGATTCASEQFTYWDSALAILQAMQALGVSKAYALGTSQGAWIVARMALLAPKRILGVIALGTSMDCESADSRLKGCWDPATFIRPFLEKWSSSTPTPDFIVGDDWIQPVLGLGLGSAATPAVTEFWTGSLQRVYSGDQGRRNLRMITICLAERDGLLLRLKDIECPVHWYQGTDDPVYGSNVPQEHIKLFTGSSDAKLQFLDGGCHFLGVSHPKEIEKAILEMVH